MWKVWVEPTQISQWVMIINIEELPRGSKAQCNFPKSCKENFPHRVDNPPPLWVESTWPPQWVFPYHSQWAMKEIEDFSLVDCIPSFSSVSFSLPSSVSHEGNRIFFPNGSYTILLLSEFFLFILSDPWRKQKIFPQWIMYHPTPQQVFSYHL